MASRRVIVIGAGAAGLMAAGQAASCGAETILLEKMERPGRKLLITGNRRCNLTNLAALPEFIEHFGPRGNFLRQAFARFFREELLAFFEEIGVPSVTDSGGRIFPASDAAGDVVASLVDWARGAGVEIRTGSVGSGLVVAHDPVAGSRRVTGVRIGPAGSSPAPASRVLPADACVLATGGASYPETGSTGDGYRLAGQVGHTIIPIRPALVPLVAAGGIGRQLQGLSLRDVLVRLLVNGRPVARQSGEILFTHFGVSGPLVLALSGKAVDALQTGAKLALAIDLLPALDERQLETRLLRDLEAHGRRKIATLLGGLLPRKLIPVCAELNGLGIDKLGHQVTAAERRRLREWLKDFRIEIRGHRPLAEAIITAGGIDLREVDPRTMASRMVDGLHACGEVLDIAADTGGYNLQAAFSTGWLAGRSAGAGETASSHGTTRA